MQHSYHSRALGSSLTSLVYQSNNERLLHSFIYPSVMLNCVRRQAISICTIVSIAVPFASTVEKLQRLQAKEYVSLNKQQKQNPFNGLQSQPNKTNEFHPSYNSNACVFMPFVWHVLLLLLVRLVTFSIFSSFGMCIHIICSFRQLFNTIAGVLERLR